MTATHGRCLCGRTRYVFDPEGVFWRGLCHCESCRRATASPVTAYLGVRDTAWRWVGPPPSVFASSPGIRRYFCQNCGTPMAYQSDEYRDETHFFTATLDEPEDHRPTYHAFWNERLSWLHISDELPKTEYD